MDPTFLSLAEILEIHRDQIERYGGTVGLRDLGLLQSALAMPPPMLVIEEETNEAAGETVP